MIILTDEQQNVVAGILKKITQQQVTSLGGYAGTGKSTIIRHLIDELPEWAVCAYTGKAANVLRKKHIESASTIHSLIYVPELDAKGNIVLDSDGCPIFVLNPNLDTPGIIIDEASMVSQEIFNDLKSFGKPLLFIGDHGQLEPIGSDIHLMKKPDFVLEEIHRNAGEIAHFAEFIRKGYRPQAFANKTQGKIKFITLREAELAYTKVDQIICGFNKTRVEINKKVRAKEGRLSDWPEVGEKVMCLRNNRQHGLFNGMQGTVEALFKKPKNKMTFRSDGISYDVLFDPKQFNKEKCEFTGNREDPNPFDFCSAITCHKAQGDQFDELLVMEQKCDLWNFRRWGYTSASRAVSQVYWASNA